MSDCIIFLAHILWHNACISERNYFMIEQVRYKKWLWWTRFATVITVLQFIGAFYLLFHMVDYVIHSQKKISSYCLLGKVLCFFIYLSLYWTFISTSFCLTTKILILRLYQHYNIILMDFKLEEVRKKKEADLVLKVDIERPMMVWTGIWRRRGS